MEEIFHHAEFVHFCACAAEDRQSLYRRIKFYKPVDREFNDYCLVKRNFFYYIISHNHLKIKYYFLPDLKTENISRFIKSFEVFRFFKDSDNCLQQKLVGKNFKNVNIIICPPPPKKGGGLTSLVMLEVTESYVRRKLFIVLSYKIHDVKISVFILSGEERKDQISACLKAIFTSLFEEEG